MKPIYKYEDLRETRYYIQYDQHPNKKLTISKLTIDMIRLKLRIGEAVSIETSGHMMGIEGYRVYTSSGGFASINLKRNYGDSVKAKSAVYKSLIFELEYDDIERHIIMEQI